MPVEQITRSTSAGERSASKRPASERAIVSGRRWKASPRNSSKPTGSSVSRTASTSGRVVPGVRRVGGVAAVVAGVGRVRGVAAVVAGVRGVVAGVRAGAEHLAGLDVLVGQRGGRGVWSGHGSP